MASDADKIELTAEPIDAAKVYANVVDREAGGVTVFFGTTRSERDASGRDLLALEYQAYEAMALKQMRELAAEARRTWPIRRLAIVHRTGRVEIGGASVAIAVSCPHRGQAFDACRFLIDQLKARVTIWKKEVWSDGATSWPENSPAAGRTNVR